MLGVLRIKGANTYRMHLSYNIHSRKIYKRAALYDYGCDYEASKSLLLRKMTACSMSLAYSYQNLNLHSGNGDFCPLDQNVYHHHDYI